MSISQTIQLKKNLLHMEDTNSESDNSIKNPEITDQNFQKMRQKLHWKITLNQQVLLVDKYILYELIETTRHYDLYRALKAQTKQRVIVKIIDKYTIKQSLIQNEVLQNWQTQYDELMQKIVLEHEAVSGLMTEVSGIFLIEPVEILENDDCIVKVTENYYDESLMRILMRRGSLPIEQALAVIKQVIFALSQLHKQNIILTELNPSSIIYHNGVFKINDLSSMRKVSHHFKSTLNLFKAYSYGELIAPELKVCSEIVDIKSEIWAIGVLFYQMIAVNVPYEERASRIVKLAKSHNVMFETKMGQASEEVLGFMRQLVETDPDERMSWKKLMNHPIFENQEYFNCPKMMPLADVRSSTLKKKQTNILSQAIQNTNFTFFSCTKQTSTKIPPLTSSPIFRVISKPNKTDISKNLDVETETFHHIQKVNLLALKAQYIFTQILQKIQEYDLIDKKRRSHLQMMLLITQRCYSYIRRSKQFQSKSQDRRIDNYLQQLRKLHQNLKQLYERYKQLDKTIDSTTYYVSNDIFSFVLGREKMREKTRMLKGTQGKHYTVDEHVRFTQEKYIARIIGELKGDSTILEYVVIGLMNYEKIHAITLEDLKGEFCFADVVTKVVNKNNDSRKKKTMKL